MLDVINSCCRKFQDEMFIIKYSLMMNNMSLNSMETHSLNKIKHRKEQSKEYDYYVIEYRRHAAIFQMALHM